MKRLQWLEATIFCVCLALASSVPVPTVGGDVPQVPPEPQFIRGDANNDGIVDIADPIKTLNYLFAGGEVVACLDAADSNDDGALDIADATFALDYLFSGSLGSLPAPFPECGTDPTPDDLGCDIFDACP